MIAIDIFRNEPDGLFPNLGIHDHSNCMYHYPNELSEQATGSLFSLKPNTFVFAYFCSQALDTFNTAVVSPIYYVMFTSLTILASVIMFK
ncbi:hypothetical protein B296_00022389, partial [Ensete ventricosum]